MQNKKTRQLNLDRNQAGDTLISIILSVAVISLVIVIAYILINNSLRLSHQAREREQVKNLVQGQIESLKYMAFKDDDGHIFSAFNQISGLTQPSEPFCLVDEPTYDMKLNISAVELDGPAGDPKPNQASLGNELRPDAMDPNTKKCVVFSSLEAANVKVWIIYDPEGSNGDPNIPNDEEHLFTVRAEWDGVRGEKESTVVAIRLPPPRT